MHLLLKTRGKKPRKGTVIQCEECGTEVYAPPSQMARRRYCSKPCRNAAIARAARTTCIICGVGFKGSKSIGRKYCTRSCYLKDRQPQKTCKACGKQLTSIKLTYCSQPCMSEGRRTGTLKPCETCGMSMYVQPQSKTKRFCSRECLSESKRLNGPGAKHVRDDGYVAVYFPSHPDVGSNRHILEHRLVAEQKYGRRIRRDEHVHHINGIRDDNRPENLEVIAPGPHAIKSSQQGVAKRKRIREELAEYKRLYGPLKS